MSNAVEREIVNLLKGRDFRASVRRIQRHHIMVAGSFIIGLDVDGPGIGRRIAEVASQYHVDSLNVLFLRCSRARGCGIR